MPRQESRLEINQFTGGLNTDSTELTSPPNTSKDELNWDLLKEGTRRRRRGMALEDLTLTNVGITASTDWISNHRWENINNDGDRNFEVVQVGSILYFFDSAIDPLIAGLKAFTVNLDDHKAPLATRTDLANISVASGKGVLFVVGEALTPFYISYDSDTDTISTTQLSLRIRDLKQLDTQDPANGALTPQRRYDLLNQGWHQEGVIIGSSTQIIKIVTRSSNPNTSIPGYDGAILDGFIEQFGESPPKTKPWWVGKGTLTVDIRIKRPGIFNDTRETREVEAFSKEAFDLFYGGNTVAPLGHYIVDPFYKDRSEASGVNGITPEVEVRRPNAVAFYGGRVFYGFNNDIYCSEVILDDLTAAERCYQDADPTAEDTIGLIASDGGVFTIPDMGGIVRMFTLEGALLLFAENGVWTLYSQQGQGFSATNFAVDFVTNLGAAGYHSIVDVEGFPFYWGAQGIYSIQPIADRIAYEVVDLTDQKLKNYFNVISPLSKRLAKGAYDLGNRRVLWLWKETTDPQINRFLFDRLLNYSLVFNAFFPYSIAVHNGSGTPPNLDIGVAGIVSENAFASDSETDQVVIDLRNESDPNESDVVFYYPLSEGRQYVDLGPNTYADATPTGTGDIASAPGFPYGSGYNAPGGANELVFPLDTPTSGIVPSRGTNPWTISFWARGNWESTPAVTRGVIAIQGPDDPISGAARALLVVRSQGTGDTLEIVTSTSEGTFTTTTGVTSFVNDDPIFISVTRSGTSVYLHANGNLEATVSVGTGNFNFNDPNNDVMKEQQLFKGLAQEGATFPLVGQLGEVRWYNAAIYGAGNYTPPIYPYGELGTGQVPVCDATPQDVVVTRTFLTDSAIGLKFIAIEDSENATAGAKLGFSDFTSETFTDWTHTGAGDGYESFIETFYHLSDDSMTYMQAPWIYTYIKRTSTTFPAAEGDGTIT